jgi:hypothetical protein
MTVDHLDDHVCVKCGVAWGNANEEPQHISLQLLVLLIVSGCSQCE